VRRCPSGSTGTATLWWSTTPSGHAAIPDLQRLVTGRVVPIHSAAGDRFAEFFPRVDRQRDGTWWAV